jgi:RimJ/RimL family protein N-acetyltransferase
VTASTDRLVIETLAPEHAPELFAALDDPRVGRFIGGPDVTTLDRLSNRIAVVGRGAPAASGEVWLNWAVRLRGDGGDGRGPVIGRIEATLHDAGAEIAYVFGPATWGHGYATEATAWMIGQLRSVHGAATIWATVDPGNDRSVALLQRVGFEQMEPPPPPLVSYDDGDLVFRLLDTARSTTR